MRVKLTPPRAVEGKTPPVRDRVNKGLILHLRHILGNYGIIMMEGKMLPQSEKDYSDGELFPSFEFL